ncbi:hypothetical protein FJ251_09385 [bacterium]|nr:hypothetical protein [bacterium]
MPEPMRHDDPRSASTAWVGIIGGLLLVLIILGLTLVFYRWEDAERAAKGPRAGSERLAALEAAQAAQLADYAWVDAEKGILRMPIEAAMARVAAQAAPGAQP